MFNSVKNTLTNKNNNLCIREQFANLLSSTSQNKTLRVLKNSRLHLSNTVQNSRLHKRSSLQKTSTDMLLMLIQ